MRRALFLICLVACSSETPQAPTPQPAPKPRPPADALEKGRPIEKELVAGHVDRYKVTLKANDVLLATVDQRGIDVVVTVLDPSDKRIAELDSPNGQKGPEPIVVEAKRAGEYRIEISAFMPPPGDVAPPSAGLESAGKYEARIDEILTSRAYVERQMKESIDSSRMFELWKAVRDRQPKAVEKFWTELKGKSPLVEPVAGDANEVLITFAYRDKKTPYVALIGGPSFREKPLQHLAGTDVWYLTARMPADSRFAYAFLPTNAPPEYMSVFRLRPDRPNPRVTKKVLDPNNPKRFADMSYAELPAAPPQPWIGETPGTPAGTVKELTIDSSEMKEPRKVAVYTPSGYDPKLTYPLIIAFDGEAYGIGPGPLIPLPRILDNLIAAKKIAPTVAVLVANQGTRNRDLTASEPFSRFVALELVPRMRNEFRAGMTPAQTLLTGSSYGGLCAAFTALQHPTVFGSVLSNSGAFGYRQGEAERPLPIYEERGWLIRKFVTSPKQPIRFYLDAGRFETDGGPGDLLSENRRMRDVLEAKGYQVTYAEFSGGHDYQVWRGTIADGLMALMPAKPAPATPAARGTAAAQAPAAAQPPEPPPTE